MSGAPGRCAVQETSNDGVEVVGGGRNINGLRFPGPKGSCVEWS